MDTPVSTGLLLIPYPNNTPFCPDVMLKDFCPEVALNSMFLPL